MPGSVGSRSPQVGCQPFAVRGSSRRRARGPAGAGAFQSPGDHMSPQARAVWRRRRAGWRRARRSGQRPGSALRLPGSSRPPDAGRGCGPRRAARAPGCRARASSPSSWSAGCWRGRRADLFGSVAGGQQELGQQVVAAAAHPGSPSRSGAGRTVSRAAPWAVVLPVGGAVVAGLDPVAVSEVALQGPAAGALGAALHGIVHHRGEVGLQALPAVYVSVPPAAAPKMLAGLVGGPRWWAASRRGQGLGSGISSGV